MNGFMEMEYRGLNIFDEISVVEIAINHDFSTIHVLDTNQVVEPEYNFVTKNYDQSDGFVKMTNVLFEKYFFKKNMSGDLENWVKSIDWIFYSSRQFILKMRNGEFEEVIKKAEINVTIINEKDLYLKYIERIV